MNDLGYTALLFVLYVLLHPLTWLALYGLACVVIGYLVRAYLDYRITKRRVDQVMRDIGVDAQLVAQYRERGWKEPAP